MTKRLVAFPGQDGRGGAENIGDASLGSVGALSAISFFPAGFNVLAFAAE